MLDARAFTKGSGLTEEWSNVAHSFAFVWEALVVGLCRIALCGGQGGGE